MKNRLLSIDFLRGVSIILVLFHHAKGKAQIAGLPYGVVGVSLFFAISGFCIHYGYLKNENFNWKDFFGRRLFRIYPLYLFGILFFVFLGAVTRIFKDIPFDSFVYNILFLQNFTNSVVISPSFWTLAIEFQLYLLYPIFIILRNKLGISKAIIFVSIPQIILYALVVLGVPNFSYNFIHNIPFAFWFNWAIGAYVAERFFLEKRAFNKSFLFLSFTLMITTLLSHQLIGFMYISCAMFGAVIIDILIHKENSDSYKSIFSKSIIVAGLISYSLFVLHQPLMGNSVQYITKLFEINSKWGIFTFAIIVYIPITILSYLTYRFIEKPGIKFYKSALYRSLLCHKK